MSSIFESAKIIYQLKAGVGNSFGFAGHIRDKLGIRRQYMSNYIDFKVVFVIQQVLSWYLMCFQSHYSYLENFKCSSRATYIKMLGGLYLARGPDVAQTWLKVIGF